MATGEAQTFTCQGCHETNLRVPWLLVSEDKVWLLDADCYSLMMADDPNARAFDPVQDVLESFN